MCRLFCVHDKCSPKHESLNSVSECLPTIFHILFSLSISLTHSQSLRTSICLFHFSDNIVIITLRSPALRSRSSSHAQHDTFRELPNAESRRNIPAQCRSRFIVCIRLITLMTHLILNSHNLKWGVIMIIPASPYSSSAEKSFLVMRICQLFPRIVLFTQ